MTCHFSLDENARRHNDLIRGDIKVGNPYYFNEWDECRQGYYRILHRSVANFWGGRTMSQPRISKLIIA